MQRTILVALTVDDNLDGSLVVDEDLADGIRARLDEFYPTTDAFPMVPESVTVTVADPGAYDALLSAASVGLDGADEDSAGVSAADLDAAFDMLSSLRGTLAVGEEPRHG